MVSAIMPFDSITERNLQQTTEPNPSQHANVMVNQVELENVQATSTIKHPLGNSLYENMLGKMQL